MNSISNLNKYIDHTLLKPAATEEDIKAVCAVAREYDFASVCVNPVYVPLVKAQLAGSSVKVCTVIGFPLGANTTFIKQTEALKAYEDGCEEFDMVINVGALKVGNVDFVEADIRAVVEAAKGKTVKVIIETGLLTDPEKELAVRIACKAGAAFVKTCTGFNPGVATVEDVKLMKRCVSGGVKVKASAGIRDRAAALALIEAGADRIGTSAGVAIVKS